MANFTALAAARHGVLARAGWDVERARSAGCAAGHGRHQHEGSHVTIYASLQMLGLGREGEGVRTIAADDQGRMRPEALRDVLAGIDGPAIVCAQAGNVNTGGYDPLREIIADRARARRVGSTSMGHSGSGPPRMSVAPAAHGRLSRRGLVVYRCAQVAQRAL